MVSTFILIFYSTKVGCQEKLLVAGSVGPYGACLHDRSEYTGDYVDSMTIQVSCDNFKLVKTYLNCSCSYRCSYIDLAEAKGEAPVNKKTLQ